MKLAKKQSALVLAEILTTTVWSAQTYYNALEDSMGETQSNLVRAQSSVAKLNKNLAAAKQETASVRAEMTRTVEKKEAKLEKLKKELQGFQRVTHRIDTAHSRNNVDASSLPTSHRLYTEGPTVKDKSGTHYPLFYYKARLN